MAEKIENAIEPDRLQLLLNNAFQKADAKGKGKLTRSELKKAISFFAEEAEIPVALDEAVETSLRSAITTKRGTVDSNYFQNIIVNLYQVKTAPLSSPDSPPQSQNTSQESAQKSQPPTDTSEPVAQKESEDKPQTPQPSESQATEESKTFTQISPTDETLSSPNSASQDKPSPQSKVSIPTEEVKPNQQSQPSSDKPPKSDIEQSKTTSKDSPPKSTSAQEAPERIKSKPPTPEETQDSKLSAGPEVEHEKRTSESSPDKVQDVNQPTPETQSPSQVSTICDFIREAKVEGYKETTPFRSHQLPTDIDAPEAESDLPKSDVQKFSELSKSSEETDEAKDYKYIISFSIPYVTIPEEKIVVVGNHELFGNWDPSKGLELKWHSENEWKSTVVLGEQEHHEIEYKYACIHPDGVRWEEGQNRKIDLTSGVPKGEKLYLDRSELWQTLIN